MGGQEGGQLRHGPEVVERLGQEAGYCDAVGRGETHVPVEVGIHEGGLHEGLTVVEDAIHLNGRDVLAKCGELTLLDGTDLALGIEHIDVDALYTEEAVGYSRTCVARGGNENIDGPSPGLTRGGREILEQTGHEAGTHILESKCGAVEEFEGVDVLLHTDNGAIERQRIVDDATQVFGRNVLAKEAVGHAIGYLLKREVGHLVEELAWQRFDTFGHIEALVLGQSLHDGLLQGGKRCLAVGAIIIHNSQFIMHD